MTWCVIMHNSHIASWNHHHGTQEAIRLTDSKDNNSLSKIYIVVPCDACVLRVATVLFKYYFLHIDSRGNPTSIGLNQFLSDSLCILA